MVRDDDAEALIDLVGAAYAEYPGCVLDLSGVDADLTTPASNARDAGGSWWVVETAGAVIASIGLGVTRDDGHAELKRLYVSPVHRGRGLATALIVHAEQVARANGADAVDLWSDTRFTAAHRLYVHLGYVRTGERRAVEDLSDTREHRFRRALA